MTGSRTTSQTETPLFWSLYSSLSSAQAVKLIESLMIFNALWLIYHDVAYIFIHRA